jgi:hypothetical protein
MTFSRELLSAPDIARDVDDDVIRSGWMGFPPATEQEIAALEERLDCALPPSYRTFLATSNGWRQTGYTIFEVWPCTKVAWLMERNSALAEAWMESSRGAAITDEKYAVYGPEQDSTWMRAEYLPRCLEISSEGDASILLLNPEIVFPDGEWEALQLASWYPGAYRFRSFRELLENQRKSFLDLRMSED